MCRQAKGKSRGVGPVPDTPSLGLHVNQLWARLLIQNLILLSNFDLLLN